MNLVVYSSSTYNMRTIYYAYIVEMAWGVEPAHGSGVRRVDGNVSLEAAMRYNKKGRRIEGPLW